MEDFDNFPSGNANPLAKYFRLPGLHVKLPTRGAFMPPGTITLTANGDIPIFPMAAKDELLLKSPDALMSGYALEKLIESCAPSIRTPRLVSTQDLDVLLLAIRAATYGENMSLDAICPKCSRTNEIICNLPALLATMEFVDMDNMVRITDDVIAYIRPYNLHNASMLALASYEETRKIQALEQQEPKATLMEKNKVITGSMERINKLNLDMLADCILKIVVPGSNVSDKKAIIEFVANVPKPWIEMIDKGLREINKKGIDKTLHVTCDDKDCNHSWQTEVEFNPSNFFDAAS